MAGLGPVAIAVILAVAMVPRASFAAADGSPTGPALAADPDTPGARLPPVGRSLFDELFETTLPATDREAAEHDIPFPFASLLAAIVDRGASQGVKTALIPLGRSLQRFAADPDYFASPRLVIAVDEAVATPGGQPFLKDRFFLGYQPAAAVIEVISYNEAAGRFEFQIVEEYDGAGRPRVEYAERSVCVTCHQGHAPIFPLPLWGETNADPGVAAKIAGLGDSFHGVPVRQGVDGPDAFDLATDRANRIAAVQRLWNEGCGEGAAGSGCRAAVLLGALRFRLGGARTAWQPSGSKALQGDLHERLLRLWPDGLWTPSPDLPNREPLLDLVAGTPAESVIEPSDQFDPTVPRQAIRVWRPAEDSGQTFGSLAREVAAFFSARDIAWIDAQLAAREPGAATAYGGICRIRRIERQGDVEELRVTCGAGASGLAVDGYLRRRDGVVLGGQLRELKVGTHPTVRLLRVAGGSVSADGQGETLSLELRESATDLTARLVSGERLSGLTLRLDGSGRGKAEIEIFDDLLPLSTAIRRMAETASDDNPLGPGPLRRRALLGALEARFEGS